MATVAPPTARTRYDAQLDADLGGAVRRIRANDLFVGGLAVLVLALAYTAGMVLLDRWLVLAMPARQAALGGFMAALGLVGWLLVVRPLRRAVNPRFAARRVEATLPDSKNAVINWVDLQDRDLPATVRAAVGRSAAGTVGAADVAKATEARPVVWLGAAAGLLAALLAVLFVVLKPAPFTSLVKRTFNPFVFREIASRTTLTLTEPATGDATVTTGDSLTVAVDVGGSVPAADGPDRLRVQVWHADGAEPDELPLEAGPDRDWRLTLPPSVIQNGFSYRVVGGDARTADHRVTVRSRPLVVGFEAKYVAPAYTRIPPETAREPRLEGYRGTAVTLLARTNRTLKRGWMQLGTRPEPVPATVVGENRDTLQFELTLDREDTYRLGFTAADDEASEPTPPYPVKVLTDQPPRLTITSPAEDAVALPANGTLAVDGEAADDFGLTAVTLRLQVVKPFPVTLRPVPYRPGKDLRRKDGTYPTRLSDAEGSQTGYKETVPLAGLKTADGRDYKPEPGSVIEYWLEATDNCAVPRPNVGTSAKKTLTIAPAVTDTPKKQELDGNAKRRQDQQKQHEETQDKQLDTERREPKQLRPDADKPPPDQQPQTGEGEPQQGQPSRDGQQPKQGGGQPQQGKQPEGGGEPNGQPQKGDNPGTGDTPPGQPQSKDTPANPGTTPKQPKDAKSDGTGDTPPKQPPAGSPEQPKSPDTPGDGGKPEPSKGTDAGGQPKAGGSAAAKTPEQQKLDDEARKLNQAIRQQTQPRDDIPPPKPAGGEPGQPQPQGGGSAGGDRTEQQKRQQQETQQAIDDLASDDPAKRQAARDKLDQTPGVGKQERERIEKLQKDLASDDPKVREQAKKELGELDRETGTGGAGVRSDRPEQVERLSRELNSDNPTTRKNAERRAERDFGPQGKDELQKAGEKLNSPDRQQQEEGKKDVDQLAKKNREKPKEQPAGGDNQPKGGDKTAADQVRQQAGDLTSKDDARRQAAERAMDRRMSPEARKDLQQKLGSDDPKQQEAGRQQVEQMAQQAGQGSDRQPTPEQLKELTEAAKDLNSADPAKKKAAQDKLDKQLGEAGHKQLQQDLKDLQSGDPKAKERVEQKIKDAAQKQANGKGGEKSPDRPKQPTQQEIDQAAEAARDLTSTDPEKRQAAERTLDSQMGPERRKQLQQQLNDLRSGDPAKQAEAAKRLEQLAKDEAAKAGRTPPTPEEAQKLADAAKDLTSPDPDKRAAAEQTLDKAVGKPAREQLQKEQAQKQPDPKAVRDAAAQALKQPKAGEGKQPQVDPKEAERQLKELTEAAKDLNSSDPAKKKAAEDALDQKVGPEARQQVQKLAEDLQSSDPKTKEAAQQRLQEAMDQVRGKFNPKQPWRPGGGGTTDLDPGKAFQDDPANRLRTAELQLKTFEKNKANKDLLGKLGYTEAEYERFLAEYGKRVEQLRQEAARPPVAEQPKPPAGAPTIKVGGGSTGPLAKKGDGTTGGAGGGKAAAGYEEAQRRFAAQAAKGKKPAEGQKP
jgi:hypothetical protein